MAHDGLLGLQGLACSQAQFKVSLERMADAQNPPDPKLSKRIQRQGLRQPSENHSQRLDQALQR